MTIKKWTYAAGIVAGFALVACTGENGADGLPGADGTSCVAKALKDGSGFDIICGDESVGTILNGEDGEDGAKGDKGDKGDKGSKGDKGDAGEDGSSCVVKSFDGGFKVLCDGDSVGVLVNGIDGDKGEDGDNGKSAYELAVEAGFEGDSAAWLASLKGDQGDKGEDGVNGKSAYELAVEAGFEGDSAAWVASLKGDKGDKGKKGDDGDNGKSAYELAVEAGFEGSEAEWRASLKGDKGDQGDQGESCTLKDAGNGMVTVTCGKSSTILFKAMCGTNSFDPASQFCSATDTKVYPLCHKEKEGLGLNPDGTYDVTAFFCDANDSLVVLCGGKTYSTATQFCVAGETYPLCHNVTTLGDHNAVEASALNDDFTYEVADYFCADNDSLYKRCEGTDTYNPEVDYCDATEGVQTLCAGVAYDLATQMCVDGKVEEAFTCCQKTGAGDNWCKLDVHKYDVRKEFCDERDGTHYKFTKVENEEDGYSETWMAENLNYSLNVTATEAVCYNNNEANCDTHGRFYTWEAANSYCPNGWSLPTKEEYEDLAKYANLSEFFNVKSGYAYNFETFYGKDSYVFVWTATEGTSSNTAYYLYYNTSISWGDISGSNYQFAVRCIKD